MKQTLRPSPTALLNPRCDPLFKAMFTQDTKESNFALQDFISALLGRTITQLELQPNEPPVDSLSDMQMSFDVSVVFDDGERADLEMQGRNEDYDYAYRAEIQAARLLNVSARKGSNWDVPKIYQISVLNFEYDKGDNNPLSWYTMKKNTGGTLGERLNIIFFDLVKIRALRGTPVHALSKLEKWGLFFAYADNVHEQTYINKIIRSEKGIMAADFIVKRMSEDDANWFRQNSYFIAERDRNSIRDNAKKRIDKALEEGHQRGLAEGHKQGIAEGHQQGLAEGRAEGIVEGARSKTIELTRAMLAAGLSSETIAQVTQLSQDEIQALVPQ